MRPELRDPNLSSSFRRRDDSPTSSRLESQWFGASSIRHPIAHEVLPPPSTRPVSTTHTVAFGIVSLLLVAGATAGVLFFLAPQTAHAPVSEPVSTTQITNADVPLTPTSEPALVPVITPADLPSAPPVTPAPAAMAPTPPPVPRARAAAPVQRSSESLPDLDRAAAAAGVKPAEEESPVIELDEPTPAPTSTDTPPDLELRR
jgi:hypothetical protein